MSTVNPEAAARANELVTELVEIFKTNQWPLNVCGIAENSPTTHGIVEAAMMHGEASEQLLRNAGPTGLRCAQLIDSFSKMRAAEHAARQFVDSMADKAAVEDLIKSVSK